MTDPKAPKTAPTRAEKRAQALKENIRRRKEQAQRAQKEQEATHDSKRH
jgi:hypothetical protein